MDHFHGGEAIGIFANRSLIRDFGHG